VSVPLWVTELAAAFWGEAGEAEAFPRQLRRAVLRALPLSIVARPGLRVTAVLRWLGERGIACRLGQRDRPLQACLVAHGGSGFIFLDADDSPEEQRFSLAHELAHFLRDYWQPRRRAVAKLGPQVLEVFDGQRPPAPEERLHALLRGVPIGFHAHLLARDAGGAAAGAEADAERDADRLAYELLAPAAEVRARAGSPAAASAVLRAAFGLPAAQAARYADLLFPPAPPPDPLLARLRKVGDHLSNFDRPGGK
jgi:hypothetical protein